MVAVGVVIPTLLVAAGCALALRAWVLLRQERAAQREEALGDRALFDSGRAAALERAERERAKRPRAARGASSGPSPAVRAARTLAAAIVAFALGAALTGRPLAGAVMAAAVGAVLAGREGSARRKRKEEFDMQFVRMLPQLAASVRSSLTIERALRLACSRSEDPLRGELTRVVADVTYGTPLATSLEDMARRTGSPDVRALASATRMQQRFGGSVAPVLDMVAAHAGARLKASRELKTELAGTRLAKWFVALSMPGIFLIMYATNADFARFYAAEPLGWAVAGAAAVLEVVGLIACRSITALDDPSLRRPRGMRGTRPAADGKAR
ncbi:type II secretion system F family protein [Arabiibacter massiliensis]|uniref:type II secretion system F family protein n=1 Tax=Arabiibacter massiliensis TaxID=1870985 RepID=UPI0009B9EE08|nr:type II secretion system F family protein [Arabiibacter massiliensis]